MLKTRGNYMFKVNNNSTRARREICSKLTIKTPERFQQSSLQESRLPILKFSQDNTQNNFACCFG